MTHAPSLRHIATNRATLHACPPLPLPPPSHTQGRATFTLPPPSPSPPRPVCLCPGPIPPQPLRFLPPARVDSLDHDPECIDSCLPPSRPRPRAGRQLARPHARARLAARGKAPQRRAVEAAAPPRLAAQRLPVKRADAAHGQARHAARRGVLNAEKGGPGGQGRGGWGCGHGVVAMPVGSGLPPYPPPRPLRPTYRHMGSARVGNAHAKGAHGLPWPSIGARARDAPVPPGWPPAAG